MKFIQTQRVKNWLFLTASVLIGALLYGPHLNAPLVFDDIAFFSSNYASRCGLDFGIAEPRWWPCWSFAMQRILGSEEHLILAFRLGNLILHILVANALFLFLRQLFNALLPEFGSTKTTPPYSIDAIAALAALAFLLHPVAVYGADYLVERSILMATLFSLLMWTAHLQGIKTLKPIWFALAVLCAYLALYSKENSVMAPAVTVLLTLMLRERPLPWKQLVITYLAYALLMISVTLKHTGMIASGYELQIHNIVTEVHKETGAQLSSNMYGVSVLMQSANFFKYIFLWAVPLTSQMSIDIQENIGDATQSLGYWLCAAAFIAWCAAGLVLLLRKGQSALAGFAMLAPALLFMTEFSTVRLQEPFVLYRSYLWAPALFAALSLVFIKLRPRYWLAASLVAFPILAVLAQDRLTVFDSEYAVWNEAIHLAAKDDIKSPMRARQYSNRGSFSLNHGRPQDALEDFKRALDFSPRYILALNGKGVALTRLKRYSEARASLDESLAIKPDYPQTLMAHAAACDKLGDKTCTVNDLTKACKLGAVLACYTLDKKTNPDNKAVTIHFK